jgi:hypothetical protein
MVILTLVKKRLTVTVTSTPPLGFEMRSKKFNIPDYQTELNGESEKN